MTAAFAVVCNDQIRPNTVSSTRRAAIVNWLVTDRRITVLADWTDDQIEVVWEGERRSRGVHAEVVPVTIERA
jgi:hypothetical protein